MIVKCIKEDEHEYLGLKQNLFCLWHSIYKWGDALLYITV